MRDRRRALPPGAVLSSLLTLALAVPALSLAGQAPAESSLDPADASRTITADDLRTRIGILAHDSMRGRDTPSPELVRTAEYLAGEFESFGLRAGLGNDEFQQRFPITSVRPGQPERQRLRLRGPDGAFDLDPREEFVVAPRSERSSARGSLEAYEPDDSPLEAPDGETDGSEEDVILLVPVSASSLSQDFETVREALSGTDAAAAVIVVNAPETYFEGVRRLFTEERVSLGEPADSGEPVILIHQSSLPEPLRRSLAEEGSVPSGWSAEIETEAQLREEEALNTIAWLPGSDPDLRNEYVIFMAHMDHVGVGRPVEGDSIYNGADDNASGTSTILEIAEAFARADSAPKRSVVFMAVSGEEKGLLGSRWYSEHPVFPLNRTVAAFNMDMIGRNWRDTVVAIGKEESSLGPLVERVAGENSGLGLVVIDDPWPEEQFYFRSDHYNLARSGVPILFFFSGVHEDYHEPGDEAGKIEYEKTARIGRLIYLTGLEVANAEERPEWDREAYRRVVEGADDS